jgi:hypothetical protein
MVSKKLLIGQMCCPRQVRLGLNVDPMHLVYLG